MTPPIRCLYILTIASALGVLALLTGAVSARAVVPNAHPVLLVGEQVSGGVTFLSVTPEAGSAINTAPISLTVQASATGKQLTFAATDAATNPSSYVELQISASASGDCSLGAGSSTGTCTFDDATEHLALTTGNSDVTLELSGISQLAVTTGSGNDDVSLTLPAGANATVDSGDGGDTVRITTLTATTSEQPATSATINAGAGDDHVYGGSESDTVYGGDGDDTLVGNGGSDTLKGEAGDDSLYGDAGNDTLNGGPGNDTLAAGTGSDSADGGLGVNTIDFSAAASAVNVDLPQRIARVGASAVQLSNLQNVIGTPYSDVIIADGADNTIHGGAGDDTITGGAGHDTLYGDGGNDTINAYDLSPDMVACGAGTDTAYVDHNDIVAGDCETLPATGDAPSAGGNTPDTAQLPSSTHPTATLATAAPPSFYRQVRTTMARALHSKLWKVRLVRLRHLEFTGLRIWQMHAQRRVITVHSKATPLLVVGKCTHKRCYGVVSYTLTVNLPVQHATARGASSHAHGGRTRTRRLRVLRQRIALRPGSSKTILLHLSTHQFVLLKRAHSATLTTIVTRRNHRVGRGLVQQIRYRPLHRAR